jgi:hypothetical protein
MRKALIAADRIWKQAGQDLVVTSGLEGEHSPGSLHYYGYALDFRTRYFTEEQKFEVYLQLAEALTGGETAIDRNVWRVINHKTHIHVEWRGLIN